MLRRAAERGAEVLTAGAGGLVLLLILGAEILDGRWILGLLAAGATVAAYRVLGGLPEPYRILQGVDHSLGLQDALSTAFYFQTLAADGAESHSMREAQRRRAERLAQQVDPRTAVPIVAPRSLYVCAALIVLASSLFALRYAVTRQLDLRPPLAAILFPAAEAHEQRQARARPNQLSRRLKQWLGQAGLSLQSMPARTEGAAETPQSDAAAHAWEQAATVPPPQFTKPVPLTAGEEVSDSGSADGSEQSGDAVGETPEAGLGSRDPAVQSRPAWADQNSNLLEQFREALANLLSRLKSRPADGQSELETASSREASDSAHSRRRSGGKEAPGPGSQSDGDGESEADGDQQVDAVEQARGASGRPGGRDSDTQPAREGRSGIGKEDGRKEVREAEQLAAMGKLTELFGRRQATLTGEVTVEVASGTQKLRTPYSEQSVRHAEAGGEVHRDEVPLLFRSYVQRYFEELRRLPAPPQAGGNGPQ